MRPPTPIFALAGGSLIFLAVIIALFLAVGYGYYTYRGSAINPHPSDGLDGAPGSEGPNQASGKGRVSEERDHELSAGGGFSTHGTGHSSAKDRKEHFEAEGPLTSRSQADPRMFQSKADRAKPRRAREDRE